MMVGPATELGINLRVFTSLPDDSAAQVATATLGDYRDIAALLAFARACDVVTFEHELVPQFVIRALENAGVRVYPHADSFIFSQDKFAMREKMSELGLPNARHERYEGGIPTLDFPLIAKAPMGGYDGKGVWVVTNQFELDELPTPLLLEEKLNFSREIALMVARSPSGNATTWSPAWTVQKDGICVRTITPVPELSKELTEKVNAIGITIAHAIDLVGVMAVELFQIEDHFIVNELALRPHNSGHWTIEGALTSQFEQHLRAILDLPLGETARTSDWAVMGNILGRSQTDMFNHYRHLMARTPQLKFHHYRKEIREGRKIGHVTLLGWNCDLQGLTEEINYAVNYLNGDIGE